MKIRGKNILIISGQSWGENWVSKHHYARVLSERANQVYFLGPEIFQEPPESPLPNIFLVSAPRIPRGLRYLPQTLRKVIHGRIFQKLEKELAVTLDLVWSFDYSVLYDFEFFTRRGNRAILYMADFVASLPWREAASSADLCLGVTRQMIRDLGSVNHNSHFLNHGFANFPKQGYVFHTPPPNVVYAGNLTIPFLDQPRLLRLVKQYPNVNFHFFGDTGLGNLSCGETSPLVNNLIELNNASVHGSVPPQKLPGIYCQADALLVCYDTKHGDLVANSHKVMEYLASGNPVLSNWLEAYEDQTAIIKMCRDETDYCNALHTLLSEKDPALAEKRRAFAMSNTYENQVDKIEALLAGLA